MVPFGILDRFLKGCLGLPVGYLVVSIFGALGYPAQVEGVALERVQEVGVPPPTGAVIDRGFGDSLALGLGYDSFYL